MYGRRKTDRRPEGREPWIGIFLMEAIGIVLLGITLALIFASSGVRAGTITLHATQYDPLKGTSTYQRALDRIQYAGTAPYVLTLRSPVVQGTLARPADRLHYYCQAPNVCRLDTNFITYIPGRVFAAGFEK